MAFFYDPDLLVQVAAGDRTPNERQPYATIDLTSYFYTGQTECSLIGGVSYDPDEKLIYVSERRVDFVESRCNNGPVIHVFELFE